MRNTPLNKLASIRNGYPFRHSVQHDPVGDLRVLQIRDLRRSETLNANALSRINAPSNHATHLLQPGDIVIPARGDHRTAVLFSLEQPTIPSNQLHVLRIIGEDVLPGYLCWVLNQAEQQHALQSKARGTGIPLLTLRSLGVISIPVPTLVTQSRIIELQTVWQREQKLTRQLLANRKHMLAGIVQQLMSNN